MTSSDSPSGAPRLSAYSGQSPTAAQRSAAETDGIAAVELPTPPEEGQVGSAVRSLSGSVRRASTGASYRAYRFAVSVGAEVIQLYGELAVQGPLKPDTTLVLLLAGGSNNTSYWDWPVDPERHSFVKFATEAGFATLNLDRPGYGKSDRPDPARMDFRTQAQAIRQVVDQLKRGALGHAFRRVILNGHSMGGMVAWHAAADPCPADGVIVSGVGHDLSADALRAVDAALQPIEEHPGYGLGTGWPRGYFVKRFTSALPQTEHDYCTALFQDTVMQAELRAIQPDSADYAITRRIRVPVLFAMGRFDRRWCDATGDCSTDPMFRSERDKYADGVDFTAAIVPDAGHLVNKDPGAAQFFRLCVDWMSKRGF